MLQFLHSNRMILQVLAGAFMISFSAIWVKIADVPPTTSGLYRVFFGFLFLLVATFWQQEIRIIQTKNLWLIIFCGIILSLNLLFWHESILSIGPGLATIVSNFQVFLLAAIGIFFFGEKIRPRFLFSIPIAVFGLLLVVGVNWDDWSPDYKTGLNFAFLAALCYAGFLISLQKIQRNQNQPSFFYTLMLISFVATCCFALKMVLCGDPFTIPDMHNLTILLSLSFFSQVLGWLLISNAMPKIRTSLTGFILLLQPALSFIWDVLFFSRPTDLINWLGVIITLGAIYMGVTCNIKKSKL